MRRFFITGTDTDCGKTYICTQLIRFFKRKGHKTLGLKPIASGFSSADLHSDAHLIEQANATNARPINLYAWEEAIAPHIAASKHQQQITMQSLVSFCSAKEFSDVDVLCIEGAGGIMIPLNDRHTWLDFIPKINAQVILVVGMKLGCINHALLSVNSLMQSNIPCVGWIANCIDPSMEVLEENIASLQARLPIPCLGINYYGGKLDESLTDMGYNFLLNSIQASSND